VAIRRLTVSQAANVLNTSEAAVRKRINLGALKSEREPNGQVYVLLDSSDVNLEQDGTAEIHSLIAAKDEMISELRGRIAFLERALEGKDKILLSITEAMRPSNQPQTTDVSETPPQSPTQGKERRGIGFLPVREDKLPFWVYALTVIAPAALDIFQTFVPKAVANFFHLSIGSVAYDIVTFPIHVLPEEVVPVALGLWVGLKRRGSSWSVYVATGFCAGLLVTIVQWFIYMELFCDFDGDCVNLISPFLEGFAVAVLFVAGTLFGNAVQRRGLRTGLYEDELTDSERAAEGRLAVRVAMLGFAGTVIGSIITAIATAASGN
jgi:hypothetical protein